MFKRIAISAAVLVVTSATSAWAQQQDEQPLQRVTVTGSAIKRTSVEGPAPVQVISKKDIEKTGATSVNALLASIPAIDVFDQGELASNSPSGSGTANIKMRGLDATNTLVLINGRRPPVNAIYDSSGAGAAFDINSLPIGAIDHIEILKDGGSAIYGADAVAGVVNFITKTDYQGIEVLGSYGQSSRHDGRERRVDLTAGFGDLSKDRYNVLFSADYFKRDPILRSARALSSSADYRRYGGGDGRSSFAPQGNVIDPNTGGLVGVTYRDCPAEDLSSGICRYDFDKSILTAYNGADRLSGMAVGNVQLNADTKAFVELTYSTSKDTFQAQPVPDYFLVPITNANQQPYDVTYQDAEGNTVDTHSVYIAGRFMQGGPRMTKRKSDFINVATGLEGTIHDYDWNLSVSNGESKVRNQDFNYYDSTLWAAATSSGELDPTSDTNDPTFVDSLKVSPKRIGKSQLTTVNAQVSGDVVALPAGMMRFALGVNWNHEHLSDQPDAILQAGHVVGDIAQSAVDASRTFKAVYGELNIPVLKTIEVQAAVRHDKYPNASATSPKIGAKWDVLPTWALRASYSGSFKEPVLKQLYGGSEQGATTLTLPEQCAILGVPLQSDGSCSVSAFQVSGSSTTLQPEKGKNFNLGTIFELGSNFNASLDWWRIKKKDDIDSLSIDSAIQQGHWSKSGPRILVFTNLMNFAEEETEGIDLDARVRFPGTAIGTVTVQDLATYYTHIQTRAAATDPWTEYVGTYANPRFRNNVFFTAEVGPWSYNLAWKYVGGFADTDISPVATGVRKVGSFNQFDGLVQYSGIKNVDLGFGIQNLFDKMPPLSLQNASSNSYTQMGFAELYSSRGRFFYLQGKYTFR